MSTFKPTPGASISATRPNNTLILPIVSLGNVAQLAADLLVNSPHPWSKIGTLSSEWSIPVVSGLESAKGKESTNGLTTAVEVYQSQDGVQLILQRSPVLKAHKDDFIPALSAYIQENNFSSVLVLAGLDAGSRRDRDLATTQTPFRHISLNQDNPSTLLTALKEAAPAIANSEDNKIPLLPASGITRRLLEHLATAVPTSSVGALCEYVAEGDNRPDAIAMATIVAKLVGLKVQEWKAPESWTNGLFGGEQKEESHTREIFG